MVESTRVVFIQNKLRRVNRHCGLRGLCNYQHRLKMLEFASKTHGTLSIVNILRNFTGMVKEIGLIFYKIG